MTNPFSDLKKENRAPVFGLFESRRDPCNATLDRLMASYSTDKVIQERLRALVRIEFYAEDNTAIHATAIHEIRHCMGDAYRTKEHYDWLMAAFQDHGIAIMTLDHAPDFDVYLDLIVQSQSKTVRPHVDSIRTRDAHIHEQHKDDLINRTNARSLNYREGFQCIIDLAFSKLSTRRFKYHEKYWHIIQHAARGLACAVDYHRLLVAVDSPSRSRIIELKDHHNARRDSKRLVVQLSQSAVLKALLVLHERLGHVINRLLWPDAITDQAWAQSVRVSVDHACRAAAEFVHAYRHVDMLDEVRVTLVSKLNVLIMSMESSDFYVRTISDPHACASARSATAAIEHAIEQYEQVRSLLTTALADTEIKLIGGSEPLVYQVSCRGECQRMILRLWRMGLDDRNHMAIQRLKDAGCTLFGEDYHALALEDEYAFVMCSQYYNEGGLDQLLDRYHQSHPDAVSRDWFQALMSQHLSQALSLLTLCRDTGTYFTDIKPSNFLLNSHSGDALPSLVVSDTKSFGVVPDDGVTNQVLFTPGYLAPEVVVCEASGFVLTPVDPQAVSYYALGVTMRVYLTGRTDARAGYTPTDDFEQAMLAIIEGLTQADPAQRLAFADTIKVPEIDTVCLDGMQQSSASVACAT